MLSQKVFLFIYSSFSLKFFYFQLPMNATSHEHAFALQCNRHSIACKRWLWHSMAMVCIYNQQFRSLHVVRSVVCIIRIFISKRNVTQNTKQKSFRTILEGFSFFARCFVIFPNFLWFASKMKMIQLQGTQSSCAHFKRIQNSFVLSKHVD